MKKAIITGITGLDGLYLTDSSNINRIIEKVHPDEIYNLGA